ncbi:hypothetical protein IAT40_005072 [Kwoniella sp. CBS 6097]
MPFILTILTGLILITLAVTAIPVTDKQGEVPSEETDWFKDRARRVPTLTSGVGAMRSILLGTANQGEKILNDFVLTEEGMEAWRVWDGSVLPFGDGDDVGSGMMGQDVADASETWSQVEDTFKKSLGSMNFGMVAAKRAMTRRMERANAVSKGKGSDIVIGSKRRSTSWDNSVLAGTEGLHDVVIDLSSESFPSVYCGWGEDDQAMKSLTKRPFCATCLRDLGTIYAESGEDRGSGANSCLTCARGFITGKQWRSRAREVAKLEG